MSDNSKIKHIIVQSDSHKHEEINSELDLHTKMQNVFLDFDLHTNIGPRDFRTRRAHIMKNHDLGTRHTHKHETPWLQMSPDLHAKHILKQKLAFII